MSWLTDIRDQNQNQNQVPVNNSVQKINKEDQGNWLQETQTEVTQKLNNLSVIDKALNWLGEAPNKTMEAIDNPESILWKGPEGINEAAKTLAWQAVTFEPSLALGASRLGYEKLRNLMVDEEKQRTPKEILAKVQETTDLLPGLVDSPKTDVGKAIVKPVEEFFHKLLKGPRKIGKDMSRFYGPNAGWLSEQVLTLGLLKSLHMEGQELQSGIGKIIETVKKKRKSSPKAKAKAEELSELLEDIKKSKEPSKYDKEFEKKVNEFEATMQAEYKAEMENILKKQQEKSNTILPQEAQKPNKLPEAPDIKLPEPAQRILDFAKKSKEQTELEKSKKIQEPQVYKQKENEKFETLDLKRIQKNNQRRIQNKIKKQQIEENLGLKEPEKISKAYHGTSSKFIEDIKKYGLQPISIKKVVENVLDELKVKGKERDKLRQTIYDNDSFIGSVKGEKYNRPFDKPEIYVSRDLENAKRYAENAGEAYDLALIAVGAFNKPEGKFNIPVSEKIAKRAKKLYEKNRKEKPIVLEVDFPGELKKGDNIAYQELKYKILEEKETNSKPDVKTEKTIDWKKQDKRFVETVKSDLDVAIDLGIYADIKEGLEAGKTRADIIQDIKKNEYLKEDMKDFEYQETDLPRAIRAVDIVEFKNSDAIKKLQKSLEKESKINEQIAKNKEVDNINRVDPEIGRKPGVEAPKQKKDSGTSDILDAYREHQKPIKFKTGEIARSRFMAEKTAQEQGLIGELVKDPNSDGWLVRPSKEQRELMQKEIESEWKNFLDDESETISETPSKKSAWNTLKDIFSNERGEIKLEASDINKIKEFIKSRKIPKIDAMDFLKGKGISQEDINKILPKTPSVQKMNKVKPDKESQWLKPGQNPNEKLPARTLKNGRKAPAVTRKDARIVEQAPNINKPILGENTRIFTSEGIFTELGKPLREVFYRRVIKGEKKGSDIAKDLIRESNKIKKGLPLKGRYKSLQRIDNYGISLQPDGKARLLAQGEKIVEKLTPKEMEVYKKLQILYKDLYNRINKVRKEVGLSPFPPVKNYTAWVHDMNKLKQMENISEFDTTETIRKGLERVSKLPTKRDIKGRTLGLGGHEKFRGGPDSPGYLKLNAIDNFNRYALTASEFLGKAEPIAYLHELLQPKFELYKNANNTYNFLNEWLDYQKGKEPIMFITNPKTRRIMKKLSGNVAVSFITYAPKSAAVQFSSFNNSIAELGLPRMIRGISRLINPKEIQRAARESNVLSTRTPEAILMDAITSDPMLPGKVGRLLHKGRKKIREVGTSPLNLTDSVVAYSTWLEGEAKGKKIFKKTAEYKNMDPAARKKALKKFSRDYADDMVVRAQGSAAKSARAPIQRTAEGGFVTTLQTFTIANFDYLARHILGIKNPDITKTTQLGKVMNWVLASYLISLAFNSIGWKSPIPEPIKAYQESLEQTRNKEKAIKEAAKELLEFIPIIGGKVRYGSELSGVVTDQLVKLSEGDLTAIPRLMGVEGFSTMLKGYRAYKKDGTAADILMGRYIKKPKKNTRKGIGGIGGL